VKCPFRGLLNAKRYNYLIRQAEFDRVFRFIVCIFAVAAINAPPTSVLDNIVIGFDRRNRTTDET